MHVTTNIIDNLYSTKRPFKHSNIIKDNKTIIYPTLLQKIDGYKQDQKQWIAKMKYSPTRYIFQINRDQKI